MIVQTGPNTQAWNPETLAKLSPSKYKAVLVEAGFVHVGEAEFYDFGMVIRNGYTVREWGTTMGS